MIRPQEPRPLQDIEMTEAEYLFARRRLVLASLQLGALDLDRFLERLDRAAAVGPISNPVLAVMAADNLGQLRVIAKAARAMVTAYRRMQGVLDEQ